MFNPISASDKIKNEFVDYLSTDFFFKDRALQKKFVEELQKQISQGPFLEINDIYKTGKTLLDLVNEGVLSKRFLDLEKNSKYKKVLPLDRPLYNHQVNAITQIVNGNNVVVSTGTGSGKTNCFLIPVINELLKELDEKGTLGDGIRALFVFPVNALANDQIKNIRMLLMNYPDITFGVYNGSTDEFEKSAEANYKATFMNSDIPELREKLPNEEISRDDMKNHPPHILFTNYAMLEYLLFRPTDRSLFENSHFKFIVLDEAHIYSGVVGIETSMLIRRLKTRLGFSEDVRFILTSAALGGSDEEIISFATNLSGAHFTPENIVRGEREPQYLSACERNVYSSELIRKLADDSNYIPAVLSEAGIFYDKTKFNDEEEFLYDFIFNSDLYYRLRSYGTYSSDEISNKGIFSLRAIQDELDIDDDTLVSFISLCTRAKKNGKQLLDAKFHFFIRTLEGCYISLEEDPLLSLVPTDHKSDNDQTRLFEVAVCRNCGEIALVGKIEDGFLLNKKKNEPGEEYFYLANTIDNDIEDGEDPEDDDIDFNAKEYLLCPKCGAISEYGINIKKPSSCHCEDCHPIKIVAARVRGDDDEKHCYCHSCYSGHQRRFYIGNDGATSVLATSLYEALPKQKVVRNQSNKSQKSGKTSFFSLNSSANSLLEPQVGQFLTFSDSRQEAAKFASYLGQSYEDFLRRRGITRLIRNYQNSGSHPLRTISDYVHDLTKLFQNTGCFKDEVSPSTSTNETQAWVAVLNELGRYSSRNSLTSLGFLQFKYLGNYTDTMKNFISEIASTYSVSEKTVLDLLDLLIMELLNTGAVSTDGDFDIGDEQREYIWYSKSQKYISLNFDLDAKKTTAYWLPRKINEKYRKTKKLKYVMNALHIDEQEAVNFLESYFNFLTSEGNDYPLKHHFGGKYTLPAAYIQILLPGEENAHWYKCDKCGRVQTSLVDGHCNYSKCNAYINKEVLDAATLHEDNHFANLYQNENMSPLVIKEHTAQLDRAQGLKYQQDFINKKINVLSCSTTFEMGVDIGDLEAVFLRDMPPSPSNYNQRAGRAGRSIDSAAYVLSFAKLSSHDFYFFNRPMNMIAGTILPPFFKLDNVDIARRHIYATVLSEFFREPDYEDYFHHNDGDLFLNGSNDGIRGYDEFCSWLNKKRDEDDLDLKALLKSSIPDVGSFQDELGLNDYSWVDGFIGQNGILFKLMYDYDHNVKEFEKLNASLIEQLVKDPTNAEVSRKIKNNTDNLNRYKSKKLIDFLSRGGVLPRYGFPVDTVELEQYGGDSGNQLNLSRDLTMAISEYAPSSEVIADNHLYTSRYINKSLYDQKYGWKVDYIGTCPNSECSAKIFSVFSPKEDITCPYCGTKIPSASFKGSIEPIAGFIADEKVKPVPMNRQERSYNAPIFYIGDGNNVDTEIVGFESGRTIKLNSTKDDSLLVMSVEPFYVCNNCGYAVSIDESNPFPGEPISNYRNALFAKASHVSTKAFKHKRTNGIECGCHDFTRYYLHHIFKTDVANITFVDPPVIKHDEVKSTMYSVMYAIFNAIRYDFQIDKNDIGCCLSFSHSNGKPTYSIIIYDQITGGSGYAKKIVKDGAISFKEIIKDAYYNLSNCDCDPSCYKCLRSYENRMYHDELDRKKAMKFLDNYIDEY